MDVRLAGVLVHLVLCRNFLHIFPSDFKSRDLDFNFTQCEASRCAWPKAVVWGLYILRICVAFQFGLIGVYYTYIFSCDISVYVFGLCIL